MTDTTDDSDTADRSEAEAGEQPTKKAPADSSSRARGRSDTAKSSKTAKTARKPARKPAGSGAPRAQARRPADDRHDDRHDDRRDDHDSNGSRTPSRPRPKGTRLAVLAAEQLVDLTGKDFEGIVGLSKSDDGWAVQVEVLEMRRIPSTTDVIAVYEVDVDQDGDLTGYRRLHRFLRGEAGDDR